MQFAFSKYHGAGNDFILVDNRDSSFNASAEAVKTLCHRHFGIGADGLILLEGSTIADFKMTYFNADGGLSSMCGNGARCIVLFANEKAVTKATGAFEAYDGLHRYDILQPDRVRVSMSDVEEIEQRGEMFFVDTGSPHLIIPTNDVTNLNVYEEGRRIRYNDEFREAGVNVNFVSADKSKIDIRTYERGVENETMACGTGCVAAAIWAAVESNSNNGAYSYNLQTLGGLVTVSFQHKPGEGFQNIFLEGPAVKVFEGKLATGLNPWQKGK